ncbi:PDZ domain-containing protein [Nocardiopsis sp. CNT-189]|uniref:YlbL family protein n=1 Tax=Nocardiopsis oceanisediminis TaxID=2816862 RepID=UPI003B2D5361
MLRRVKTLLAALTVLCALAVGAAYLPVPYLVASPGLALNTLGDNSEGDPVIHIEGTEEYRHDGGLSMVTVQYAGGPDARLNILSVIGAWLSPTQAVLPEAALFPPDRSIEDVTESQTLAMDDSQTTATAAALNELGVDYGLRPMVAGVQKDAPAEGELEQGDIILEVDGEPVKDKAEAAERVGDRDPGDEVELTVDRAAEKGADETALKLTTEESDEGGAVVGIMIADDPDFPFEVEFQVGDIGGPSAGMMFALGIMDRLDPDGLTGGKQVAGTGTIDTEGRVGGVSGVAQKMVSARDLGAEYFLVAEESCAQTFESAAAGDIEVLKVAELSDAVRALEAIKSGEGLSELPRCEPGQAG